MTLKVIWTSQFKKDYKRLIKQNVDIAQLDETIRELAKQSPLPKSQRDHSLTGEWSGYRECHIQPDWVLIYRVVEDELILVLVRIGSHADLFG